MTSSSLGSGARGEWLGWARHQFGCVAAGLLLATDALVRSGASTGELVFAVVTASGAIPLGPRESVATWVLTQAHYLARPHCRSLARGVASRRGATTPVRCYELIHRGRLDLAVLDEGLVGQLVRLLDAMATEGARQHVSLRVERDGLRTRTLWCTTSSVAPPSPWRETLDAPCGFRRDDTMVLERRHYLRGPNGVTRVVRVEEFDSFATLSSLAGVLEGVTVAVHADVEPSSAARRRTQRAVHRANANALVGARAGFRPSAVADVASQGHRDREAAVAQGAALCRWATFVLVSAPSRRVLDERLEVVRRRARDAGLTLDEGRNRQWPWWQWSRWDVAAW